MFFSKSTKNWHKNWIKNWVEALFYAMGVVVFLYFTFWPFEISGSSMESSFFRNDRVAISRIMVMINNVQNGDVVICRINTEYGFELSLKRIIASPGDSITIKNGMVFLNENELKEPYLANTITTGNIDLILSEDEYFVMGDNRGLSYDSRHVGVINRNQLVGRVVVKWYPFSSFELF